ncbi:MAG: TonB family protein [Bdellovibrio sp.]|nr:TonB family protein [Bdellovibrio sp.]
MAFNQDNERNQNDGQLSFFDFKMTHHDFVQESSAKVKGANAVDYDKLTAAHRPPAPNKTPRFLTMSATLHVAAILAIGMMAVPLIEQTKTETITIELEEPPHLQTQGAPVLPTKGGSPAPKDIANNIPTELPPKVETKEVAGVNDVVAPAAQAVVVAPAPAQAAAPKAAKVAPVKAPVTKVAQEASHANAGRSVAPKATMKAVPATIDDIDSPELDAGELASAKVAANMNEDFNEDFDRVDSHKAQDLDKERAQMDAMAAALTSDQEESLKSVESQNQEEAAALATNQQNLRKKNAKAIASALASERAAADAAAREQSQRDAAERAAVLAAARAAQSGNGANGSGGGRGEAQGNGAGNNGLEQAGNEIAGAPTGIRSLDQLRQMPGNPRPQYDIEERRRGDTGKASFIAYITKEGVPVKFRQTRSTGHANLDSKTLAALKKWRFYPGQEGWVEMPFQWDIKGDAEQDGGRLRAAVSQN